jgi:Arc/MetJ-type ribon-helix-helix transcriptional regulator
MVQEGFYSNRTDFIRTAIRNQIERHGDAVKRSVAHQSLDLGLRHYSREDLEAVRAAGLGSAPSGKAEYAPAARARASSN